MSQSVELESASCLHLSAATLVLVSVLMVLVSTAQAGQLNDTGQITCYNATGSTGLVHPDTPNPVHADFEGQDCTLGAAAADALGAMTKQGASSTPGRDYTKVSNAGDDLPASAALGSGADDWACTRDNVTGLVWEVKVNDPAHLRHLHHIYTWYEPDSAINGGTPGIIGIGNNSCNATLPSNQCNTTAFRDAINALADAARLCGATDWRLPTDVELQSLVDYGPGSWPRIDPIYFPNSLYVYWTGVNYAPDASNAWSLSFYFGDLDGKYKGDYIAVRLVRGG